MRAKRRLRFIVGSLIISGVLTTSMSCAGQSAPSSANQTSSPHPIPLHHRYAYFLRYQISLDKKADTLDQANHPDEATAIRSHIQKICNSQMARSQSCVRLVCNCSKTYRQIGIRLVRSSPMTANGEGYMAGRPGRLLGLTKFTSYRKNVKG